MTYPDIRKPFYMAKMVSEIDFSWGTDSHDGVFATEAEAVEHLRGLCDEHSGSDGLVYRVTPLKRVWRGRIRVDSVRAGK